MILTIIKLFVCEWGVGQRLATRVQQEWYWKYFPGLPFFILYIPWKAVKMTGLSVASCYWLKLALVHTTVHQHGSQAETAACPTKASSFYSGNFFLLLAVFTLICGRRRETEMNKERLFGKIISWYTMMKPWFPFLSAITIQRIQVQPCYTQIIYTRICLNTDGHWKSQFKILLFCWCKETIMQTVFPFLSWARQRIL